MLTAAHCRGFSKDEWIPIENLKVVYGLDDLAKLNVSFIPKTIRSITKMNVHPNYKYRAYSDVMLIEVDEKVTFTDAIYPVCLPSEKRLDKNHLFQQFVTTVGFGPENPGNDTQMKQISQKIRSFGFCKSKFRWKKLTDDEDTKIRGQMKKTLPAGFRDGLICSQNL